MTTTVIRRDYETTVEFEVPTPDGLVIVVMPMDLSPRNADVLARRIAGIIRAMYAEPQHGIVAEPQPETPA